MILVLHIWGSTLIFLHTKYGITFDESLESTRQLCTLRLKILEVKRNSGVWDLDFLLIKAPSTLGSPFFWSTIVLALLSTFEVFVTLKALVDLLTFTLFPLSVTSIFPIVTSWGPWICCKASRNYSLNCVILHSSNIMILSFIFFKSSTTA